MKLLILIPLLFLSFKASAGSMADESNRNRLELMKTILTSAEGLKIIESYGAKGFVFDGMNWENSFVMDVSYYNLRFKKFDMEVIEKSGKKTFIMITKTCDHVVTLKSNTIIGDKALKCKDEKAPVFQSGGRVKNPGQET